MMRNAFKSVREDYQNGDLSDAQINFLYALMQIYTDDEIDKEKFDEVMKGDADV